MKIIESIFQAYDIRGIVDNELTRETVALIAKAIGSESIDCGERNIVIGRDGRLSSKWIADSLVASLKEVGCHIVDIGMIPTPVVYYATATKNITTGIMITGSHNPPEYNGFKIIIAGQTLFGERITSLLTRIKNNNFYQGAGSSIKADIDDDYIDAIVNNVKINKKLKIVIDCGNGVAGKLAAKLYRKLGMEVEELFCTVDGTFPNHHPDPSKVKNLTAVINKVITTKADIGLAFDGDGDRLGVIDNLGNIIMADRQMMLYSKDIISRNKNAKIIFDIKCSSHLPKYIKQLGGTPIISRTGHSFIKEKIKQENADLGGEMSGHIFFTERWFDFDDALYAAARLLEIIANNDKSVAAIFAKLPNSINTPEININFKNQEDKFIAIDKLSKNIKFENAKITTIDGIRVDYPNGWGLVRASNTTPSLTLRFEADDEKTLMIIKQKFKNWLDENNIINALC